MVCEWGTDKDVEVLVVYSTVGLLSLHVNESNVNKKLRIFQ